jgi:hypothetical protein
MKHNFKKTTNIDYYIFLPSMNHSKFMEIQYNCQLLCIIRFNALSILIFDIPCHFQLLCLCTTMDQIILYKSSSFSIHDVVYRSTFLMSQALRYNTCNIYFEVNLTKFGFGNGGHYFIIITSLSHSC